MRESFSFIRWAPGHQSVHHHVIALAINISFMEWIVELLLWKIFETFKIIEIHTTMKTFNVYAVESFHLPPEWKSYNIL